MYRLTEPSSWWETDGVPRNTSTYDAHRDRRRAQRTGRPRATWRRAGCKRAGPRAAPRRRRRLRHRGDVSRASRSRPPPTSTASSSPEIVRDLEPGATTASRCSPRNPSSFTPFPDGRSLLMGPDAELTRSEIAKFSTRDAERVSEVRGDAGAAWPRSSSPRSAMTPPDLLRPAPRRPPDAALARTRVPAAGRRRRRRRSRSSTGPARPILDRWFESEELKATLATDAIIGAMASPSMPGTGYVLFHHVMGEADGGARRVGLHARRHGRARRRRWRAAARDLGAEIRCDAEVARILVRDGRAVGVALASGDEFHARDRGQQRRRPRDLPAAARPGTRCPGLRRRRSSASATRARR